jgi:hypothetical protein
MTTTTIGLSRGYRLRYLVLILVLVVFVAWYASLLLPVTGWISPFLCVFGLFILAFGFFGYTLLFRWTYRLEFGPERLRVRAIWYPFSRPFSCDYQDIVRVQRGPARSILEIVPRQGKSLRVSPKTLDGGLPRLLQALSDHIQSECIEPNLNTRE